MPTTAPHPQFRALLSHPAVHALRVAAQGVATHLVGGVLRDHALGLPCHDYDAVVARDGLAIAQRLANGLPARLVHLGGKEFAAYRLVGEVDEIDLWDREGSSFNDDLERRDFTVNALALDVCTGELVDRFHGLDDLRRGALRAVGPKSFSGDPLRVLRLARLSIKLPGFAPEAQTLELARAAAPALPQAAAERIRDELALLLAHEDAARGLSLLHSLHLYPGLWIGSPGVPGSADGALAEMEVLSTCSVPLRRVAAEGSLPDLRLARLAATFRHLPSGIQWRARLDAFRDKGYLSPREAQAVRSILEEERLPVARVEQRRFFHRLGALWGTAAASLTARDCAAGETGESAGLLSALASRASSEAGEAISPSRLLRGNDLQDLFGIAPGPEVGELLRSVLEAQVDGEVTTREEALALVRSRCAARDRTEAPET